MLKKIVASMALAITALATVMSLAHADALDDIKKAGKIPSILACRPVA